MYKRHIEGMTVATLEPHLKKIFEAVTPEENLILVGAPGRGKTHLAIAILKRALVDKKTVRFVSVPQWLMELKDMFGEKNSRKEIAPIIEDLGTADFLVLDDLGANRSTEWAIETLYCVLNRRDNEMLGGLIITTNLTPQEITKHYGSAIASRISRDCKMVELGGDDRRQK